MNDIQYQLPIEHLSYSAMRTFCANRAMFKKIYILNDYDYTNSIVGMAGKGFHKVMENHLMGMKLEMAIQKGVEETEATPDSKIDFGKTGSREEIIKQMTAGVNFYLAELPDFGEIISTEKKIVTDNFTVDGQQSPIAIKVVTDVIGKLDAIHLHDHKLVSAFTDKEDEQPDYIMQAMFNKKAVEAELGEKVEAMHYHEVKKSKNRDGSPQVQTYSIIFDEHPEYEKYFGRMLSGVILELINPDIQFLPNFSDHFTGKDAWKDFTAEVMDFNMPKRVSHKSRLTTYSDKPVKPVEERAYVPSIKDLPEQDQIISKLQEFGVVLNFEEKHEGANVTLYTYKPSRGVQMRKLRQYEDDIQLALGSESVRIEAPLKGTQLVGIEVSNEEQKTIDWSKDILGTGLEIPVGQDVYGKNQYVKLNKAPHLLVAGATGAGKSVFLNTLITSLTEQNDQSNLGLILIDPKKTEFVMFEDSTHLEGEIWTEVNDIDAVLQWLVEEMNDRYSKLKEVKARDIDEYNKKGQMKRLVVVIDELADLILNNEKIQDSTEKLSTRIEKNIIRLAQKSRASGIHLVVATQRPSVDVVTGILKANFPTRVAFMTSSEVDSTVILDQPGAEKLIGNGDLLLKDPRRKNLTRLQGFYL